MNIKDKSCALFQNIYIYLSNIFFFEMGLSREPLHRVMHTAFPFYNVVYGYGPNTVVGNTHLTKAPSTQIAWVLKHIYAPYFLTKEGLASRPKRAKHFLFIPKRSSTKEQLRMCTRWCYLMALANQPTWLSRANKPRPLPPIFRTRIPPPLFARRTLNKQRRGFQPPIDRIMIISVAAGDRSANPS